jgi:hypothetical protein
MTRHGSIHTPCGRGRGPSRQPPDRSWWRSTAYNIVLLSHRMTIAGSFLGPRAQCRSRLAERSNAGRGAAITALGVYVRSAVSCLIARIAEEPSIGSST